MKKPSSLLQKWLFLLLIIYLSLLGVRDLFKPGFYESHDGIIHVMRLAHFDDALRKGQFPVRWLPTWMAGYGSPVFNYIWPLPYYAGSFLHVIGFSFETAVQIIFLLGFISSGLFFYIFINEILDDRLAALVGSVFYLWAPYRFTNIFVRGALGEATAMLYLPLMFWLVVRVHKRQSTFYSNILAITWALLILTHNIMAIVFSVATFIFGALLTISTKHKISFTYLVLRAFILGAGLSTVYWLPALAESGLVRVNEYLRYSYSQHFVPFSALLYSPWRYAYAWPQDQRFSMSFQVGWVHLTMALLSFFLIGVSLKKVKMRDSVITLWVFSIIVSVISVFLICPTGKFFLDRFPVIALLNYPWRLLVVVAFSLSCFAACVVKLTLRFKIIVAILLIVLVVGYGWNFARIISWPYSATDITYRKMVRTNVGFLPDAEFLPPEIVYHELLDRRGLAENHEFFEATDYSQITIQGFQKHNLLYTASIQNQSPTTIRANTFYFPGWQIRLDNQPMSLNKDQFGLINFTIPAGRHEVRLMYTNTPIRALAADLNLIILGIFLVLITTLPFKRRLVNLLYKR